MHDSKKGNLIIIIILVSTIILARIIMILLCMTVYGYVWKFVSENENLWGGPWIMKLAVSEIGI